MSLYHSNLKISNACYKMNVSQQQQPEDSYVKNQHNAF